MADASNLRKSSTASPPRGQDTASFPEAGTMYPYSLCAALTYIMTKSDRRQAIDDCVPTNDILRYFVGVFLMFPSCYAFARPEHH